MELREVSGKRDRRRFVDFVYDLYDNDPGFVDTGVYIMRTFLHRRDHFTRSAFIRPLQVCDQGHAVAQCMLIIAPGFPYLQVGFFDAESGRADAVALLLAAARTTAGQHGLSDIVIGLNGHVSCGVGILTSGFNRKISLDSLFGKPYYAGYFENFDLDKRTLTTYVFPLAVVHERCATFERRYRGYTYRPMNMRDFRNEMLLFGSLCNRTLHRTYLWFDREPLHFAELMDGLRPLLRPEHLIFVMKEGREIGFLLWHPDFHEVIPAGKRNTLAGILVRSRLFGGSTRTVKINAIGVLPEYRRSGAVIGLMMHGLGYGMRHHTHGETNFVWDSNRDSTALNLGLHNTPDRTYAVFLDHAA